MFALAVTWQEDGYYETNSVSKPVFTVASGLYIFEVTQVYGN